MSLKLITVEDTVKTKVLGFRDNKFSYDTYQMIRPMTMFQEKRLIRNLRIHWISPQSLNSFKMIVITKYTNETNNCMVWNGTNHDYEGNTKNSNKVKDSPQFFSANLNWLMWRYWKKFTFMPGITVLKNFRNKLHKNYFSFTFLPWKRTVL
jgi:hypothetical protein